MWVNPNVWSNRIAGAGARRLQRIQIAVAAQAKGKCSCFPGSQRSFRASPYALSSYEIVASKKIQSNTGWRR
jgi:hypothetical protein